MKLFKFISVDEFAPERSGKASSSGEDAVEDCEWIMNRSTAEFMKSIKYFMKSRAALDSAHSNLN
jgi:hypothetical protein